MGGGRGRGGPPRGWRWTSRRPGLVAVALAAALGLPAALTAQDAGAGTAPTREGTLQPDRARESLGPIQAEEYTPLARLGSTPMVEGASTLPAGTLETSVTLAYGNHFQFDSAATHDLQLDLERLVTAVDVRWGVSEALEVAARLSFETTGGGILDGFIDRFHDVLGVDEPTREETPRNAYRQRLADGTGTTLVEIPARRFALEDVRLRGRWRFLGRSRRGSALAVRAGVRIPTAGNAVGDEAPEADLSILGRVSGGRLHLHAVVGGATVAGAPDISGRREAQLFGAAAAEVGLSPSVSGLLQAGFSTSRLRGFEGREVDGPHTSVLAGLRGRHGRWGWQAGFQEDLPGLGSSADFTLVLGVSRQH